MHDTNAAKRLYEILPLEISIVDFPAFYESLTEKVPVSIINETWFLENLTQINKKALNVFKRIFDIMLSILLGIPALIVFPVINKIFL